MIGTNKAERMIERNKAISIFERAMESQGIYDCSVDEVNGVIQTSFGWVIQCKHKNSWLPVFGRGPLIIDGCDGSVHGMGTAKPNQYYIDQYERMRGSECLNRYVNGKTSFLMGGTGEPFLFLHGLPGSALSWNWIGLCIATKFRVLIPDLLGFGQSAVLGDIQYQNYLERQAEEIQRILMAQEIGELYVGCHDFSLAIVFTLLRLFPGLKIKGFLICSPSIFDPQKMIPKRFRRLATTFLGSAIVNQLFGTKNGIRRIASESIKHSRLFWVNFERHLSQQSLNTTSQLARSILAQGRTIHSSFETVWESINIPTLVLWGDLDTISPLSLADLIKQKLPNAKLEVYRQAAHYLPEERPTKIVEDILKFF